MNMLKMKKLLDKEKTYIISYLSYSGGYLVAPAASSLSEINTKKIYWAIIE